MKKDVVIVGAGPAGIFTALELIRKAHEVARRDGFLGTDDAALLEHAGMPVYLCEGSRENLKLTTPTDLMLAGLILAARAEKELIG